MAIGVLTAVTRGANIMLGNKKDDETAKAHIKKVGVALTCDFLVMTSLLALGILGALSILPLSGVVSGALIGYGSVYATFTILEIVGFCIAYAKMSKELESNQQNESQVSINEQ